MNSTVPQPAVLVLEVVRPCQSLEMFEDWDCSVQAKMVVSPAKIAIWPTEKDDFIHRKGNPTNKNAKSTIKNGDSTNNGESIIHNGIFMNVIHTWSGFQMISGWIANYTGWLLGKPPLTNKRGSWNQGQIGWKILKIWNHQVAEYQVWCEEHPFANYWICCRLHMLHQGAVSLISKFDFGRTGVVSITNSWDYIRWEHGTYDCKTCIHEKLKSANADRRECAVPLGSPDHSWPICLPSPYSHLIHWSGQL